MKQVNYIAGGEMTGETDLKLFEMQSEICQTLANPKRLMILHLLKDGELAVAEMIKETGLNKANLSQHLAVLKQKGILTARREGLTIFYKLALPRITEACGIMREILLDSLRVKEELAKTILGIENTRKELKRG
jgi:ArsR family transcriptional regulator, virulence genes transcriptional regulator